MILNAENFDLHKCTEWNGKNVFRAILEMVHKFFPNPKSNP